MLNKEDLLFFVDIKNNFHIFKCSKKIKSENYKKLKTVENKLKNTLKLFLNRNEFVLKQNTRNKYKGHMEKAKGG